MNLILLDQAEPSSAQTVLCDPAQIQHIHQVLQLGIGDHLKVGQKHGNIGTAVINEVRSDQIILTDMVLTTAPPAKLDLTVILALPRPKVLRRLIMDMTAIGVRDIVLVNSYRTDKSYWQSPMLTRLDEFVHEGLQQGMDTVPPNIYLKKRFKPFVEDELSLWAQAQQAVVAHPYAATSFSDWSDRNGLPQILCIGAEGGWIEYEIELLHNNGCHSVNLGDRILRTEAAVNALCGRYF